MVGRNEPINELKAKAETLAMCLIKRSLNGMVDWIEPSRSGGAILVDEMNHANDALICMCDSAGSIGMADGFGGFDSCNANKSQHKVFKPSELKSRINGDFDNASQLN